MADKHTTRLEYLPWMMWLLISPKVKSVLKETCFESVDKSKEENCGFVKTDWKFNCLTSTTSGIKTYIGVLMRRGQALHRYK